MKNINVNQLCSIHHKVLQWMLIHHHLHLEWLLVTHFVELIYIDFVVTLLIDIR